MRKAKAKFFIDIINDSKGNSRQTWENINRALKNTKKRYKEFELQVHGALTKDKDQISSMFNSYFIDSVQDLAQGFGLRGKVITPSNDNLPLFSISEVPDSSIIKLLGKRCLIM